MKTCKDCKWWALKEDYIDDIINPLDPDTYQPMKLPFEVKYCLSPLLGFYERPVVSSGACMVDGSEYTASLITGPDFGCVNWEAL